MGSLRAVSGADLSLELVGVVETLDFQSGDDVEAGKVLLKLRDFDDVAKLKSLQAQADLAKITYDRDVKQLNAKAVAQAVVDNDEANLRNIKAQVEQQQALVDKKTLKAPFAGHLGIRQVDLGQYLAAGTTIVTLQALTPIYVDFLLPQKALAQLRGRPAAEDQGRHVPGRGVHRQDLVDQRQGRGDDAATSRSAPRSTTPTTSCCPACSRRSPSIPARRRS